MTTTNEQLERRLDRERKARAEAEAIAEAATRRLYDLVTELESSKGELERIVAAQREFVSIAAHELQTPVTPIAAFADMLTNQWDELSEADKRRWMEVIGRQAHRLRRLTTLLLDLSRIEAGTLSVQPSVLDAPVALDALVSQLAEGRFDVEVRCDPAVRLLVDPDHFQTIVGNLLENAFKHGSPPFVLTTSDSEGWVELRVQDSGAGVPDEFLPRLFDKFAQAHFGSNPSSSGTGLGLYLVRSLARAHGGDAWYEPARATGASFVVRLPAPVEHQSEEVVRWRSAS